GTTSTTSSSPLSHGCTGSTNRGCTATAATCRPPSTKQRSTLPYKPIPPGLETNSPSLHQTQGGSCRPARPAPRRPPRGSAGSDGQPGSDPRRSTTSTSTTGNPVRHASTHSFPSRRQTRAPTADFQHPAKRPAGTVMRAGYELVRDSVRSASDRP